jgi:F0F1-type ATP synthase assembly protein I
MPDDKRNGWNVLAEGWMIAIFFPAALVAGVVLGYFADKWLGISPWGKIAGAALGAIAGFINLFKVGTSGDGNGNAGQPPAGGV